jgi:uncharacterized protein (DUF2252 family)
MNVNPERLSVAQRVEKGKAARKRVPRTQHADWTPEPTRPDPVDIIAAQNTARVQWLVPIRHSRMGVSPFTFYRGAAAIMAADLAATPDSDLWVQDGGDAHLSNFGAYASPSRKLVFDANDFDETLPGPWEWDLKRLTASLVVASEHLGFPAAEGRKIAAHAVRSYRLSMADYAQRDVMDLWYDHLTIDSVMNFAGISKGEMTLRLQRFETKAKSRTSLQALKKLTTTESGSLKIRSQPPLLVPLNEMPGDIDPDTVRQVVHTAYQHYLASTDDHIQLLLSRFTVVDVAFKVVGVGSVGTRCWIMLLLGRDEDDPLFLQIKEAVPSVLEKYLQPSEYSHHGRRVVEGQRLIQAQTDIFLGWTTGMEDRQFYVRQLRDWKGSANLEQGTPRQLHFYADLCGRTLARGHARSGDPVAISAYMGSSARIDDAIAEFSVRYAKQNLADYQRFQAAISDGTLPVSAEAL